MSKFGWHYIWHFPSKEHLADIYIGDLCTIVAHMHVLSITYRILDLRGGILHVVSRCYVLGNATSDPTAFKIPQVPINVLAVLRLYSRSFKTLNAVESSIALSNYYIYHADPCNQFYISHESVHRSLLSVPT